MTRPGTTLILALLVGIADQEVSSGDSRRHSNCHHVARRGAAKGDVDVAPVPREERGPPASPQEWHGSCGCRGTASTVLSWQEAALEPRPSGTMNSASASCTRTELQAKERVHTRGSASSLFRLESKSSSTTSLPRVRRLQTCQMKPSSDPVTEHPCHHKPTVVRSTQDDRRAEHVRRHVPWPRKHWETISAMVERSVAACGESADDTPEVCAHRGVGQQDAPHRLACTGRAERSAARPRGAR